MRRNVGGQERLLRALIGGALIGLGASRSGPTAQTALGLGLLEMATVVTRFCPINEAMGRSSYNEGREPTTRNRVPKNTPAALNSRMSGQMRRRVDAALEIGPHAVDERLEELDREWDVERALEVDSALSALIGLGLGTTVDSRYLAIPAITGMSMMMHAYHGWCPTLAFYRALGFRTTEEIIAERNLLKASRGDYRGLNHNAEELLTAVRA